MEDQEGQLSSTESEYETDDSEYEKDVTLGQSNAADEADGLSKKKKKKKKKKNKKSGEDGNQAQPGSEIQQLEASPDADAKYSHFLQSLQKDTVEPWCSLKGCRINDKRIRKLLDAMKTNQMLTELDLSCNAISDDGAKAIFTAFEKGAVPNLISLQVGGNAFTEVGISALESVQKVRKNLKIDTKTPEPSHEPRVESSATFGDKPVTSDVLNTTELGSMKPLTETDSKSSDGAAAEPAQDRLSCLDEDSEHVELESAEDALENELKEAELELAINTAADMVKAALEVAGEDEVDVPRLASHIVQIVCTLDEELGQGVIGMNKRLDEMPAIMQQVAARLEEFAAILDLVPIGVPSTFGRKVEPAIGSHRVHTAELLFRVLQVGSAELDQRLASIAVAPKVFKMMLEHPWNNCFHGVAMRVLQTALQSPLSDIWLPLLKGGQGSMPSLLASSGTAAAQSLPGNRLGNVSHVLSISQVLITLSKSENVLHAELREHLKQNEAWQEYIAEGGALETLKAQLEGNLCGPKPTRMPQLGAGGAGALSGRDLLAMFQGLRMG